MDDPHIHDDEQILIRSTAISIKSRMFDATFTTRRIILSDKERKNVPPKEIPLDIIQTVYTGENAIGEAMITLGARMKDGRQQKLVLTFSREGGRFRGKERDEWARIITDSLPPVSDERMPAGRATTGAADTPATQPAYSFSSLTRPASVPASEKQIPAYAQPEPPSVLGTYCTKCGTKVPEGSGFCNNCGTPIHAHGGENPAPVIKTVPPSDRTTTNPPTRIPAVRRSMEPDSRHQGTSLKGAPVFSEDSSPAVAQPDLDVQSQYRQVKNNPIQQGNPRPPRPVKPPRDRKKLLVALGAVLVIVIVIVAAVFILPKLVSSGNLLSSGTNSTASSITASPTVTTGAHVTATKTTGVTAAATETSAQGTQITTVKTTSTQSVINQASSIITTVPETTVAVTTTRAVINQAT